MSLILGLLTLTVLLWVWPILYFTVSFLYRSATIGTGSATLGMRLMNIELRNGLGQRLSPAEAMIHTGLYLFLSASVILQLISVGLMLASRRHQGLHDHILGSAAINRPPRPVLTSGKKNVLRPGPRLGQHYGRATRPAETIPMRHTLPDSATIST